MAALTDMGFNFRSTAPYVTDASNMVPVLAEAYSHTYTASDGQSTTGGWEQTVTGANRSNSIDVRLAGNNYVANNSSGANFRVDLPQTGVYTVSIGFGDTLPETVSSFVVLDGTTVLISSGVIAIASNKYWDATVTERTSAANWASNAVGVNKTFATTICRVRIGSLTTGDYSTLAHLRLTYVPPAGGFFRTGLDLTGLGGGGPFYGGIPR